MRSAMSFYVNEYGSYPFGSHKLVFVEELPAQGAWLSAPSEKDDIVRDLREFREDHARGTMGERGGHREY